MLYTSYQPGDEINWTIMMMNMKVALMTIMKMEDRVTGRGDLGLEGYPPDKVFIKDHFGDGGIVAKSVKISTNQFCDPNN